MAALQSTTKLHRLEEKLDAVGLDLTPQNISGIDAAFAAIPVQGARCPQQMQTMTGK